MKKRDIVNLIRYHVEGNENAFREEAGMPLTEGILSRQELVEQLTALLSDEK